LFRTAAVFWWVSSAMSYSVPRTTFRQPRSNYETKCAVEFSTPSQYDTAVSPNLVWLTSAPHHSVLWSVKLVFGDSVPTSQKTVQRQTG
jgi:hypothetical protein